nr:competence type IV pilus assembly protein ComGB [uncultured Bacillus sp.]
MNVGYYRMKRRKWPLSEQARFLKMTGELLSRGYPLADAMNSILNHLPKRFKDDVAEGIQSLKSGERFSQVLQKLAFHDDLVGYVFFAEQHGGLAEAFRAGSSMIEKRVQDMAKLQKLLAYPIFLILITLLLFIFMQKLLLPQFTSLFAAMNIEENFFTRILTLFGSILPLFVVLSFLFFLFFAYYYFFHFRKLPPLEQKRRLLKIPFASSFFRLYCTHYFSIQLSYLLGGGLAVNEAFFIFERNVQQPFYSQLGQEMKWSLMEGEKLDDIVRGYPFFEKELSVVIHHGQKNGKLEQELAFFAQHCLQMLEEKMEKMMKKIQPAIYAVIGLVIVAMYLAVLLPMFHIIDGI